MVENIYEVKDNVTKELDILVCEDPNSGSSKLQKATTYGVKIMSYDEFLILIENGNGDKDVDDGTPGSGPVRKIILKGTNYDSIPIPIKKIWFANDNYNWSNEPSENCIGIEASGSRSWMDEEDDEIFVCEMDGVKLITADDGGKTKYNGEWKVQDLIPLIKENDFTIRELFARLKHDIDEVIITGMAFVDEKGKEYEMEEDLLEMEPIGIPEENQLAELWDELMKHKVEIDDEKVGKVENAYGIQAPYELKAMITKCTDDKKNILVRGDSCIGRILSFDEVLNPIDEFKQEGLIPVMIDCWEQSYFVYDAKRDIWMNIESKENVLFEDKSLCVVLEVYEGDVD